jgi:hypothetical protein
MVAVAQNIGALSRMMDTELPIPGCAPILLQDRETLLFTPMVKMVIIVYGLMAHQWELVQTLMYQPQNIKYLPLVEAGVVMPNYGVADALKTINWLETLFLL